MQLSPAERQLIECLRDVKRRKWGRVTVDIENGMIAYIRPEPRIRALKDIDICGESEYNVPNS